MIPLSRMSSLREEIKRHLSTTQIEAKKCLLGASWSKESPFQNVSEPPGLTRWRDARIRLFQAWYWQLGCGVLACTFMCKATRLKHCFPNFASQNVRNRHIATKVVNCYFWKNWYQISPLLSIPNWTDIQYLDWYQCFSAPTRCLYVKIPNFCPFLPLQHASHYTVTIGGYKHDECFTKNSS